MNELPVPVPAALVAAIVRGARQGHLIAARTHNDDELWDEGTFGVNRYRLSVNWIMQEADGIAGVTAQSDKGGGKHLCCNGLRHSFHNGGTNAKWDPNTYDFDAVTHAAPWRPTMGSCRCSTIWPESPSS